MTKILSLFILVFLPMLAGILVISPFFPNQAIKIRRFAKGIMIFELLYSCVFLASLNLNTLAFQFKESLPFDLISSAGITLGFGIDPLSGLMIVLTTFISLLSLIASKSMIQNKHKIYYSLVLILTGCLIGIFSSNDLFTFFMFFELELIPMYFLISAFGGEEAKKSAMKYVIYTFAGSLFMLASITLLYAFAYDTGMFITIETLSKEVSNLPILMQFIVSAGFLIAFLVKIPIFPLHTWLADAHTNAPTPVSMMLAGILLKVGAYGLIRFNLQAFSDIFQVIAPALIMLGVINIIWASLLAFVQSDIKRIVAYSSIAHMGVVVIGIASISSVGLNGAVFQMIAHGLISAGLFMSIGVIYLKMKTRKLELLGGLAAYMPKLMKFMFIISLGAVAFPFTAGFIGEILCLFGAFNTPLLDSSYPMHQYVQIFVIAAAIGVILSAIYIFKMFHRIFYSSYYNVSQKSDIKNISDLLTHQSTVLITLAAAIFIFGIYPTGILNITDNYTTTVISEIQK